MKKTWIYKPLPAQTVVQQLSESINVNPVLATLLVQRGITDLEEAKDFFRPSLEQLHNPFEMKDMDKAVSRLEKAISQEEKILIYGDYDVDGTTSVSLFYSFLIQIYSNIEFYIPDRYQEGYGVSQRGLDYAVDNNFKLVVTLDCGIQANEIVAKANLKNVDFIICDHHNPSEEIPNAVAVLDPKQKDCLYPFKELSGCGVGFKLLEAFCEKNSIPKENLFQLLDYLAISIACDIVPIVGENRILTKFGLDVVNTSPKIGIAALMKSAGFTTSLNVSNLVFGLGPRINAAGRIAHANQAVNLLISDDAEEAETLSFGINKKNELRKDYDSSITDEALAMIENEQLQDRKTTVLYSKDWHKGVIGIVASRCIEHYFRPTIILTESNGKATGSARSVVGFDIHEAIGECKDTITQFGGHKYAAGLTLPIENIPAFQKRFEEVVSRKITEDQLIPKVDIDLSIKLDKITFKFLNIIKQMSPFGPENRQPVFASHHLFDTGSARILKEKHLKLSVKQEGGKVVFDAIAFGMADQYYHDIISGKPFSLAYTIEENTFRGSTTLQLMVKDISFEQEM